MAILAALTLVALVLTAGLTDRTTIFGATAVGGLGLVWLFVNQPMEGIILLRVSRDHGLTAADLAGFAALALALWRFRLVRRTRTHSRSGQMRAD